MLTSTVSSQQYIATFPVVSLFQFETPYAPEEGLRPPDKSGTTFAKTLSYAGLLNDNLREIYVLVRWM